MSDGRSSAADSGAESDEPADETDSGGPGGGPQRVVSETSVDDILNSLDEAKSGEQPERDEAKSGDQTEHGETAATQLDGDYVESVDDSAIESGTDDTTDTTDTQPGAVDTDDDSESSDTNPGSDDSTSIDDAAPATDAVDGDETIDELADRVERGTVTGADVRAAEAGEGREKTPEIDEVELTMDDLDETSGSSNAAADDAGPLAGSIDEEHSTESDEGDEESAGFLDRIRGLFSR